MTQCIIIDEVAENIELGNEPKAGLASMETLDDSTKDPWTENGDTVDTTETKTNGNSDPQNEQPAEKPINIWESIQSYECSIGKNIFLIDNVHAL